jgi:hypothetical protein
MGGIQARRICAAMLGAAAINLLPREAGAQPSEGTVEGAARVLDKDAAVRKKRAARTPMAGEQKPGTAAEPAATMLAKWNNKCWRVLSGGRRTGVAT